MDPTVVVLGSLARFLPHTSFTKVQERVIPALLHSDENVVVAAPTGSGKTVLLEVAMLKLFQHRLPGGSEGKTPTARTAAAEVAGSLSSLPPLPCTSQETKAVYICPIKALAYEKYQHWTAMFAPLSVVIETGDQEHHRGNQRDSSARGQRTTPGEADNLSSVWSADIIITTPERWDSITRRWKERTILGIVNAVRLLLLDEVHTVHEERGAALEAVVSRMKAIKAASAQNRSSLKTGGGETRSVVPVHGGSGHGTRLVAISGTLPNIKDVARWLQVPPDMVFSFSASDRPVPLTIKVHGFPHDSNNPFAFDRFLSFKLFGVIRQYSGGRPSLVFCASRKETVASAQRLVQDIRALATQLGQQRQLDPSGEVLRLANEANDKQLRSCLLVGIAFHHAAMTCSDRQLVERLFREQYIAVICTTTTLALGVNLPAHLVVVKGTSLFKNGSREDVPLSEMAQMCGRAGRPGLDEHGVAVVLTTERKKPLYECLQRGDVFTTVESQLHRHMVEHVNAEVALRTIHSFASGVEWVRTTFFWIRLQQCPQHYGLSFATKAEADAFRPERFVEDLVERVLRALSEEGCVRVQCGLNSIMGGGVADGATDAFSEESADYTTLRGGGSSSSSTTVPLDKLARVESTAIGRSMARLYVLFGTVKALNDSVRRRGCRVRCTPADGTGRRQTEVDGGEIEEAETTENGEGVALKEEEEEEQSTAQNDPSSTLAAKAPTVRRGSLFQLKDVLCLLCLAEEFVEVRLRQGDRGPLNEMNKAVRFPLKTGHRGGREVREDWQKAYVLIQAQLRQLPINDVSLRNDSTRLWTLVPRLARFVGDYAWSTASYTFALHADLLRRCLEQHVWPDGLVLKQLDGVGDAVARALTRGGYRDLDSILTADPRKLEVLCGRLPPFGAHLRHLAASVARGVVMVAPLSPKDSPPAVSKGSVTHYCVTVSLRREVDKPVAMSSTCASSEEDLSERTGRADEPSNEETGRETPTVRGSFLLLVGDPRTDSILLKRFISVASLTTATGAPSPQSFDLAVQRRGLVACTTATATTPSSSSSSAPNTERGSEQDSFGVHLLAQHAVGVDVSFVVSSAQLASGSGGALTAGPFAGPSTGLIDGFLQPQPPPPLLVSQRKASRTQRAKPGTDAAVASKETPHAEEVAPLASDSVQNNRLTADESTSEAASIQHGEIVPQKTESEAATDVTATAAAAAAAAEGKRSFAALCQDLQWIEKDEPHPVNRKGGAQPPPRPHPNGSSKCSTTEEKKFLKGFAVEPTESKEPTAAAAAAAQGDTNKEEVRANSDNAKTGGGGAVTRSLSLPNSERHHIDQLNSTQACASSVGASVLHSPASPQRGEQNTQLTPPAADAGRTHPPFGERSVDSSAAKRPRFEETVPPEKREGVPQSAVRSPDHLLHATQKETPLGAGCTGAGDPTRQALDVKGRANPVRLLRCPSPEPSYQYRTASGRAGGGGGGAVYAAEEAEMNRGLPHSTSQQMQPYGWASNEERARHPPSHRFQFQVHTVPPRDRRGPPPRFMARDSGEAWEATRSQLRRYPPPPSSASAEPQVYAGAHHDGPPLLSCRPPPYWYAGVPSDAEPYVAPPQQQRAPPEMATVVAEDRVPWAATPPPDPRHMAAHQGYSLERMPPLAPPPMENRFHGREAFVETGEPFHLRRPMSTASVSESHPAYYYEPQYGGSSSETLHPYQQRGSVQQPTSYGADASSRSRSLRPFHPTSPLGDPDVDRLSADPPSQPPLSFYDHFVQQQRQRYDQEHLRRSLSRQPMAESGAGGQAFPAPSGGWTATSQSSFPPHGERGDATRQTPGRPAASNVVSSIDGAGLQQRGRLASVATNEFAVPSRYRALHSAPCAPSSVIHRSWW